MNRISILLFQLVFFAVLILPATSQDQPKDQATEKAKAKAKAKIAAKAKAKQAGNPRPFQRIVLELDANMNMMLERSEVPKEAQKQFDELLALMDKNGDKALDRTELQAAGERIQKIFGGMPPGGNAPTAANTPEKVAAKKALAKKAMARKEAANQPDPLARLKQMDKDGDGVISREEWVGQPQGFNRADTNGDGKLDAEEQSRAAEIMKRFIEAAKKKALDN